MDKERMPEMGVAHSVGNDGSCSITDMHIPYVVYPPERAFAMYPDSNYPKWIKENVVMTALIMKKNTNGCVLASDMWDTGTKHNHIIRKLSYSRQGLMIGSAGQNSIEYDDPYPFCSTMVEIHDYMDMICKIYDGTNIDKCMYMLLGTARLMLDEIRYSGDGNPPVIDFFVVYFDKDVGQIKSTSFSYGRYKHPFDGNRGEFSFSDRGLNADRFRFFKSDSEQRYYGSYENYFMEKQYTDDLRELSLEELKNDCVKNIEDQISFDEKSCDNIEDRLIGGSAEWVTMDSDGNIDASF